MAKSGREGTDYSPLINFAETCTQAVGYIVELLITGCENLFKDSEDLSENVNFEYITLIQTAFTELMEEMRNNVQLYVDCNADSFKYFTSKELHASLLRYSDLVHCALAVLAKPNKDVKYKPNKDLTYKPSKDLKYRDRIIQKVTLSNSKSDVIKLETTAEEGLSDDVTLGSKGDVMTFETTEEGLSDDGLESCDAENQISRSTSAVSGNTIHEVSLQDVIATVNDKTLFDSVKHEQVVEGESLDIGNNEESDSVAPKNSNDMDIEPPPSKKIKLEKTDHKFKSGSKLNRDEDKIIKSRDGSDDTDDGDTDDGDTDTIHGCTKSDKRFKGLRLKNWKRHLASNKELQCNICNELLDSRTKLKRHLKTHFICPFCKKQLPSSTKFKEHVAGHTKPYICSTCGVGFSKEIILKAHKNIHTGEAPFECEICHKGYRERYLLTDHMRYHKAKVPCEYCSVEFSKKSNLYRHIEMKHGITDDTLGKKHMCDLCEIGFSYIESYEHHMRKTHPDIAEFERQKYRCKNCGVRCTDQDALNDHALRCKEQAYACDVCSKTFSNKILLSNHKRYHKTKSLSCPQCGKRFVKSYDLKGHIMRLHDNERPLKCEYCFKGFVTKTELKKHVVTHTGVSQFQCHICRKCFICNQVLQRHVTEVHMRIANFVCDLCGEKFRDARCLRNHISRHDDNKPFKCPECGKGFAWTTGLTKHKATMHDKKTNPKSVRRAPKVKSDQTQQLAEHILVATPATSRLAIYQADVKTELSALEVSAAESIEIQSVVYESQPTIHDTTYDMTQPTIHDTTYDMTHEAVICEANTSGDGGAVIYYQTEPCDTQAEQPNDGEIQLIIYNP